MRVGGFGLKMVMKFIKIIIKRFWVRLVFEVYWNVDGESLKGFSLSIM